MDYALFKELGIIAVVAIPLFFLIKWMADEFNRALTASREERKIWAEIFMGFQKVLLEHSEKANSFHRSVQEQHNAMITILDRACKEHGEMILALGRINGYKHE